jgi:phospholipid/cholesterol/gamma-HCH transport system substrate-binding protein
MGQSQKNIAVGILTLAAIGLCVWVLLFLHPSLGDGGNIIRVRFSSIDKLAVGTRVDYAGKPVGEVVAIKTISDDRSTDTNDQDPIYAFELTLSVDSHIHVFNCDDISLKTQGLMGERTIAITPRRAKTGDLKLIGHNELVYATSAGSVEDTFSGINNVAKKLEKTMDEVLQMQGDVQRAIQGIEASSIELKKLLQRANDLDVIGSASKTLNKLESSASIAESTMKQLADGQGTLGKLVADEEFYLKTLSTMNKVDLLMGDVNQYGMLFHLDKGWQRERRKRVAELAKLEKPEQFKEYLNEEVQKITLCMGRVNQALEKANTSLAKNPSDKATQEAKAELNRTYAELLGQLQQLEQNLKALGPLEVNSASDIADTTEK